MENTIKRKVYINSKQEIESQNPAYRCATPAPNSENIWTDDYGQSYEYTCSPRSGSSDRVEYVYSDGDLVCDHVSLGAAGLRFVMNLIANPEFVSAARPDNKEVLAWDPEDQEITKQNVEKHVVDIPMKDGTTIPMQIDNYIKNSETECVLNLKTLYSIKAQRFDGNSNDYDGSEIDQACEEFYNQLAPEIQARILTVTMDKKNGYAITGMELNKFGKMEISANKKLLKLERKREIAEEFFERCAVANNTIMCSAYANIIAKCDVKIKILQDKENVQ